MQAVPRGRPLSPEQRWRQISRETAHRGPSDCRARQQEGDMSRTRQATHPATANGHALASGGSSEKAMDPGPGDLTAPRGSEEAPGQSEEQFRLLVQAVKDYAILMLDPEGRVTSWNAGAERIK